MVQAFVLVAGAAQATRPWVRVLGRILVTYHPDANDYVIDLIKAQG
jgi:predicted nucleotide-binding protein (sugar kinase/HSP70/actin superfamily)